MNSASRKNNRKPGTLYRVAGCLWAMAALVSAIGGHTVQPAVYLAMCAVFLILGRKKAQAANRTEQVGGGKGEQRR